MIDIIILGFAVLLLGFLVWRFAAALHCGSLYAGVFFGSFEEIERSKHPGKFYRALVIRVILSTVGVLLALGLLRGLLWDIFPS